VDRLRDIITGAELPDEAAAPPGPSVPLYEPLPPVTASEIVGLLEYLDAHGRKDDIFRVALETGREFGHVIAVVKAAEMLDLVDTPKRLVTLTEIGCRFLKADAEARKKIWRERLLTMALFREIAAVLERQPRHEVPRDFVLETIVLRMPSEHYEKTFETLVRWARFGNLFAYDEDEHILSLQEPSRLDAKG
jgi:NitT/TauT family transport system ATP-binding protein